MPEKTPELYRNKMLQFSDFFSRIYPEKVSRFYESDHERSSIDSAMVKNVTFIVTDRCNLRCTYCYEHNKSGNNRMSRETAQRIVDLLFDEYEKEDGRYISPRNAQAIVLDFIGGEPLLEIDLIDWTVDYFRMKALKLNHPWALNHWISISTNGIDYDNPKVERFLNKNTGRISITISLDGDKELHDSCRVFPDGSPSYDIVIGNFKKHLQRFGDMSTKITLAPGNIEHLFSAHKHMLELGIKNLLSNAVYEEGWTTEHGTIMYREMKKLADLVLEHEYYKSVDIGLFDERHGHSQPADENRNWCGGTGNMLAFGWDGRAFPCLRYAPLSLGEGIKPIVIGDLETGLENTPEYHEVVDKLSSITRLSQSPQKCIDCPISSG